MNSHIINFNFFEEAKPKNVIYLSILFLLALNIFIDFVYTVFNNSAFYLSESILFSSFWFLFIPLVILQNEITKRHETLPYGLLSICALSVLHLLAYPLLIWFISFNFYSYTFSFLQTFDYGLNTYLIKAVLVYSFSFAYFKNAKHLKYEIVDPDEYKKSPARTITTILVSDANNKVLLDIVEILYISANTPYVTIHHRSKNYLHNESLKALSFQLDSERFVRIHRSFLVNLIFVKSYRSRNNGDYDLTLADGTELRLSRKYAANFKSKFSEIHRLDIN